MTRPTIDQLKEMPLLRDLAPETLSALQGILSVRTFAAGETVFKENENGASLFLILSGRVRIAKCVSEEGETYCAKTLSNMSVGDFFGEMAILDEPVRSATAAAESDLTTAELTRADFDEFAKTNPSASLGLYAALAKNMARRLRTTSNELAMLFDISELIFMDFEKENQFLSKLLSELRLHLGYNWTMTAHIYNIFSEEYELAGAAGPGPLNNTPDPGKLTARDEGWRDDTTYIAVLPGNTKPDGYLFFQSPGPLAQKERDSLQIPFGTIARIANSVVDRIRYARENTLRDRLAQHRQDLF